MSSEVLRLSGWEKWHDVNAGILRPLTEWFCTAIEARPGLKVLDAACGTGIPSIAIAEKVRPGGTVAATDVSPVMIGAARRKSAAAGASNIEHREMDVSALDYPDASFDAVTCSFGLMFLPDPVKGASELHRVLRPGGRYAVTAWDVPERCPFFMTMFGTVARWLGRPPPEAGAPGPLRLSPPGELERVLRAAGFADVTVEPREVMFAFDSLAMHWELISDMAAPVEQAAATLSPDDLAKMKAEIAAALQPYMQGDRVRVPNTALAASGTR